MTRLSMRRRIVAVLLLPFLMVLAGCGKIHADFEIKDLETINASFDLAVDTEFAETQWSSAEEFCSQVEDEYITGSDAPEVASYEENGQYGCTIEGVVSADDFGSDFSLTEEDGEFHLTIGTGSDSLEDPTLDDLGLDFQMSFTFPGKIIEANGGTIEGNTVTYSKLSEVSQGIDIRAEAGGGFGWLIFVAIALVLGFLLLLLIAVVAFFVIRSRKNKGGGSTPTGVPAAYGAAASAAPQGQPWNQSPAPAAPQAQPGQPGQPGQSGQQWGQASPPPAPQAQPGQPGQQWGQASPPPAPQGQPGQQGQQWGQASPPPAPQGQPDQSGQQWSQPQQPDGQQNPPQWGQPDQGQQPPQNPGW